jgi:hypothetical protein
MRVEIRNLTIKNYRSNQKLDMDGITDTNVIIGRNNVGKTNILRAIELFYADANDMMNGKPGFSPLTPDDWFHRDTDNPIEITVVYGLKGQSRRTLRTYLRALLAQADEISTRVIKNRLVRLQRMLDRVKAKKEQLDTLSITRIIRWRSDRRVSVEITKIKIGRTIAYVPELGRNRVRTYRRLAEGTGRAGSTDNPFIAFRDKIIRMTDRKVRFFSSGKVKIGPEPRNPSSKDVPNELYRLHTGPGPMGDYRRIKESIVGLPFPTGELRPVVTSPASGEDGEAVQLFIDITEELSLPLGHLGEGLQRLYSFQAQ